MMFHRFENLCDCGRKKVAGAIACSTCYDEVRGHREQVTELQVRARMIRQAGLEAVGKALDAPSSKA